MLRPLQDLPGHRNTQLFPHLNRKLKTKKGIREASTRNFLTLTFPLYNGSGLDSASSSATSMNQKWVHIHGLELLFYQEQTRRSPSIYHSIANIRTFSTSSSEVKVGSTSWYYSPAMYKHTTYMDPFSSGGFFQQKPAPQWGFLQCCKYTHTNK